MMTTSTIVLAAILVLPLIAAASLLAAHGTAVGLKVLQYLDTTLPEWARDEAGLPNGMRFGRVRRVLAAGVLKLNEATAGISAPARRSSARVLAYGYAITLACVLLALATIMVEQQQRELAIWELLIAPALAGLLLAACNPLVLVDWVNAWGQRLSNAYEHTRTREGAVSKWGLRPTLYAYSELHRRLERTDWSAEWKAGCRLSAILYIVALATLTVAAVIGIILVIVAVIAAFAIAGWLIKIAMEQAETGNPPKQPFTGFRGNAARTRLREGLFGPYREHTDDLGRVIGTSRTRQGIFGDYVEHRDSRGNITGETRAREGILGDYLEHTDDRGNRTGETRQREGIFGPYEEHTDRRGNVTGESRSREGIFGAYTEHTPKE